MNSKLASKNTENVIINFTTFYFQNLFVERLPVVRHAVRASRRGSDFVGVVVADVVHQERRRRKRSRRSEEKSDSHERTFRGKRPLRNIDTQMGKRGRVKGYKQYPLPQ